MDVSDEPSGGESARGGAVMSLRERKKQRTRQEIHRAAAALMREQGVAATTVEQICATLDVSARTFFNYFPSKRAAALNFTGEGFDADALQRFESADGALIAAISDLVAATVPFADGDDVVRDLVDSRPELLGDLADAMLALRSGLTEVVRKRLDDEAAAARAVRLVLAAASLLLSAPPRPGPLARQIEAEVGKLTAAATIRLPDAGHATHADEGARSRTCPSP